MHPSFNCMQRVACMIPAHLMKCTSKRHTQSCVFGDMALHRWSGSPPRLAAMSCGMPECRALRNKPQCCVCNQESCVTTSIST